MENVSFAIPEDEMALNTQTQNTFIYLTETFAKGLNRLDKDFDEV